MSGIRKYQKRSGTTQSKTEGLNNVCKFRFLASFRIIGFSLELNLECPTCTFQLHNMHAAITLMRVRDPSAAEFILVVSYEQLPLLVDPFFNFRT